MTRPRREEIRPPQTNPSSSRSGGRAQAPPLTSRSRRSAIVPRTAPRTNPWQDPGPSKARTPAQDTLRGRDGAGPSTQQTPAQETARSQDADIPRHSTPDPSNPPPLSSTEHGLVQRPLSPAWAAIPAPVEEMEVERPHKRAGAPATGRGEPRIGDQLVMLLPTSPEEYRLEDGSTVPHLRGGSVSCSSRTAVARDDRKAHDTS